MTPQSLRLDLLARLGFSAKGVLYGVVGLFGYAAWRMLEGIVDSDGRGSDLKDLAVRGSYVARGLLHGYLGWKVLQLYRGFSVGGNSEKSLSLRHSRGRSASGW